MTDQPALVPYLTVDNARAAIGWYGKVFGAAVVDGELFEEVGGHIGHATMQLPHATFYLSDEYPELGAKSPALLGGSTAAMVLRVDDADETYDLAVAEGASADRPVQNQHGSRAGWLTDPWGHRWSPTSDEKPDRD
ncbi:MAG: PhnB protein [Acidimicrobiales bacterium]|jgi:PhnB protein